jgi:predicted lipoprotein with Yx(FWY)xxD motif
MVDMETVDLGDILTNGKGQVVYTYDPDGGKGSSTCTGACADAWPPVLVTASATAGPGVQSTLLGTTTRADGTVQVTYGGWPLYVYSGDTADGTATGQGIGGKWWVMSVAGTQARN